MNTVKAKKRMAGLLAACMTIASMLGGGASADSVTVTADKLNVRAEANASGKVLGVVRSGDELSFVSKVGTWYQVRFGKQLGFVAENYADLNLSELEEDVEGNTQAMSAVGVVTERVNIRALPKTDAKIVRVADKKKKVEIIGKCGAWYQVKYDGRTGYLMGDYVTLSGEVTAAPAPTPTPAPTAVPEPTDEPLPDPTARPDPEDGEKIYAVPVSGIINTRVNMRAGASIQYEIEDVLGVGARVSILGELKDWYKVSAEGKTGYVVRNCVDPMEEGNVPDSEEPGDDDYSEAVTGTATARVNMRKTPSTDAKIIAVLGKGRSAIILGENGGWYKVSFEGKEGYVSKSYLVIRKDENQEEDSKDEAEDVTPDGTVSYPEARTGKVTARVNMRERASTSASILKVLSEGTTVTVTGEQGIFYQVQSGSRSGYIAKDYVRLSAADSEETQPEVEKTYSEAKTGRTTAAVNMRAEPEGKVLHTLSADTPTVLTGELGNWYKVFYDGDIGYISKSYVDEIRSFDEISGGGRKGYITAASVNMRKGPDTQYGVIKVLKRGAEVQYFAIADGWYLVRAGGDVGYIASSYVSKDGPAEEEPDETGKVILSDWFKGDIQDVLDRGEEGVITDVKTGLKFRFTRTGGYYHADAQPSTSGDTEIMLRIYGGKWKWDRRAIWVTVDGKTYAASMNGMPHGETDSIKGNNFDGCFCIHFLNSKTHGGDRVDSAHQEQIQAAYKAGK